MFCCNLCRQRFYDAQAPPVSRFPGTSTSTVGTIGELEVAVDLLKHGFEVFRSVSPSCSCDLAILKDHCLLKIEVTTGYFRNTGTVKHGRKDQTKFDVLAVCTPKGIIYKPELDRLMTQSYPIRERV